MRVTTNTVVNLTSVGCSPSAQSKVLSDKVEAQAIFLRSGERERGRR